MICREIIFKNYLRYLQRLRKYLLRHLVLIKNDYLENYATFAAYVTDNRLFLASTLVM